MPLSISAFRRKTWLASTCLAVVSFAGTSFAQTAVPQGAEDVEEIVVTASGFRQKIEQAPASISVLSRKELEQERHQSLAEALANVEGVDVGASAGKTGGLEISMRGMGSAYTLVLVDGRRQNAAGDITPNGFGETGTSFLPPMSAIERIEVVRGPVSTLYGSDAMGGVINIITRKVGDTWTGTVNADATVQTDDDFGNQYGVSAYVSGPLVPDRLGLTLRARHSQREATELNYERVDGALVPLTGLAAFRGNSPVKNEIRAIGGRLSFTPHENHDFLLEHEASRQWYDNSKAQLGGLALSNGYGRAQIFSQNETVLSHNWRLPFGELQSTLSRAERETVGRKITPAIDPARAGWDRTLEATNVIFDTKLFSQWRNHTFTLGGQYWDAEMVDGMVAAPYEATQWALFAEDEWRFTDTLALTLGVRYDDHDAFGDHFSPRAYLVWNATPNWTLKGGVSQGYKTPRLDQLADGINSVGGQGTVLGFGNPNLKPETVTTTEFAVFYDNRSNFRVNASVFYNNFEDAIRSAGGGPNSQVPAKVVVNCSYLLSEADYNAGNFLITPCTDYGYYPGIETFSLADNIAKAETYGLETAFTWLISPDWALNGNYTYLDSEQKDGVNKGEPLTNASKHSLNARVRWQATESLNLWLRGEYRSKRFRQNDTGTNTAKATHGDYRAYELFHLGGSYRINDHVTFNAAIYNVLDKDFVSWLPYTLTTGATAYTNVYANNQEPRRLWVSMTTSF